MSRYSKRKRDARKKRKVKRGKFIYEEYNPQVTRYRDETLWELYQRTSRVGTWHKLVIEQMKNAISCDAKGNALILARDLTIREKLDF